MILDLDPNEIKGFKPAQGAQQAPTQAPQQQPSQSPQPSGQPSTTPRPQAPATGAAKPPPWKRGAK